MHILSAINGTSSNQLLQVNNEWHKNNNFIQNIAIQSNYKVKNYFDLKKEILWISFIHVHSYGIYIYIYIYISIKMLSEKQNKHKRDVFDKLSLSHFVNQYLQS